MRKIIFYLVLTFILPFQMMGQGCPQFSLFLSTQGQVDSFSILYPDCTELNDNLLINDGGSSDISSLDGLSQITSIAGQVLIQSTDQLVNLEGLNNLTSIGEGLSINSNSGLTDISALENLTTVPTLQINSNNSLTSIEGLLSQPIDLNYLSIYLNENLQTISGFEGITSTSSTIAIHKNYSLTNIEGFNSLTTIGTSLRIESDSMLTTLSGFSNLTDVGTSFKLIKTNLVGHSAFGNLNTVGTDIEIKDNPFLTSLTNLIPTNGLGDDLRLENNNNLTDVQALSVLTTVPRAFSIHDNHSLTNIDGASNIQSVQFLSMRNNEMLTDLSGFQSLEIIEENLELFGNGIITDMSGFSSLVSLKNLSLGSPSTSNSLGVQSLNGLQGLTSLENLVISSANQLVSLQGLENITNMKEILFWDVNALTNFSGMDGLEEIDRISFSYCNSLETLQGLNNLQTVNGSFLITANPQLQNLTGLDNLNYTHTLYVNVNESLTSLDGIENLTHIDSVFRMNSNDNLVDISALQNANLVDHLDYLRISTNPLLSVCSYDNICDYLTNGGNNLITGNNSGCGSQVEVFDVCISNQNNTRLEGNVWADFDLDCTASADDIGVSDVLMLIQGANYEYFFAADSSGNYSVPVLAGDYILSVVSPSAYWTACTGIYNITATGMNDTITNDFFLQPQGDCSYVDWTMILNGLRVCGTRTATLNLCNHGVQDAENVLITIDLGEYVSLESASIDYTTNPDGTIMIALDSLDLFECMNINLDLFTDCDSVEIEDVLCVDVSLMMDELCAPDTLWDESNTIVSGYCDGDSIYFHLENIGLGDMIAPADFRLEILIEDIVLLFDSGNYQLASGEGIDLAYAAMGEGYSLEVDQTTGHPIGIEARATVPNCNEFLSGALVNLFPNSNGDPLTGTFCTFAANSFDPNDKSATPRGTGDEHFIETDWQLNYTIQFQNTGNDVAYEVVIRDTLSEHLDLSTLQVRGATHEFTWQLYDNREIEFTFENILLPDSTSNEPESHGMVSYSIYPKQDLVPLTKIENRAGIYFDFNEPIITNTVFHTIRKPVITIKEEIDWCVGGMFNGISIQEDTTIIEITEYAEYDSAHITSFHVVDIFEITEMVNVPIGEIFENIEINGDTTFTLNYISSHGCDSIVTYQVTAFTVGIDDLENPFEEVQVFPNPASEKLIIDASKLGLEQTYSFTNTLGVLVWEKRINPIQSIETINLKKLPAGIYWLEGKSEEGRRVWKIMVSK